MSKEEMEECINLQSKLSYNQVKTTDKIIDKLENIYSAIDNHSTILEHLHNEDKYIFDRLHTLEKAFIAFVIITIIILTFLVLGFYIYII